MSSACWLNFKSLTNNKKHNKQTVIQNEWYPLKISNQELPQATVNPMVLMTKPENFLTLITTMIENMMQVFMLLVYQTVNFNLVLQSRYTYLYSDKKRETD